MRSAIESPGRRDERGYGVTGTPRYPGYDVLSKREGISWNEATRRTVDARLRVRNEPRFFTELEWLTLCALCERIIPQRKDRSAVPLAALLAHRLASGRTDGFRRANMPPDNEAWCRGLGALEAEARARYGGSFHEIDVAQQEALLHRLQTGDLSGSAWGTMSSREFFQHRVLLDLAAAYYGHPAAWNEIGFGGPASPRGYVRMDFDRRDPWEAAEAAPDNEQRALRANRRVR
jgi:hypothetical protein